MKVIELLNLVYEKKAPKRVLYKYCEYEYIESINDYRNKDMLELFSYLFQNEEQALYLEVEIIEEEKPFFGIDESGYIHTPSGSWKARKMDIEFVKALNYLLKKEDDKE